MAADGKQTFRLGFLAAVELPERGFAGGLLVTNHQGRPLEFQCTAPVKPNRTQEILYGPTLVPFILADLIGATLLQKVSVKPDLVLIESRDLLELRRHIATPVAWLADAATPSPEDDEPSQELTIGRQRLKFHQSHQSDRGDIEKRSNLVPKTADLMEPFDRIREALKETMATGATR